MEQRIGNPQQNPHYYLTEPSLIPSSNNGRSLSGYPLRRHNLPDLQNSFYPPIPDQTLEAAFSSLNLSPEPPLYRACLDPNSVGEGLLPSDQQQSNNNVSLRSLRFQDGQMGFGVGPRNPTVGPEGFLLRSPPPAAAAALVRDSWLYGDDQIFASGLYGDDQSLVSGVYDFDYYLNLKKQLNSYYPNTQLQSPMQSLNRNTSNLSVDSHLLNNQLQLPQQFNFLNLNDFKGRIVSLAKDQHWSRVLQAKFSDPTQEQIEMVLSEVIDYIGDLMNNQFGNYFVQKLIIVCNEEQMNRIIVSVTTNFQLLSICLNPHGYD